VLGRLTDFFGGYWHDEDFGMAHCAADGDKPGRKIWIWGLSREGMIKHAEFAPYATDTWTEHWLPVKGIKGFVSASPWGALNVTLRAAAAGSGLGSDREPSRLAARRNTPG